MGAEALQERSPLMLSPDEAAVVVEALEAFTRRLRPKASSRFRGSGRAGADGTPADRLLVLAGGVLSRADRILRHGDEQWRTG